MVAFNVVMTSPRLAQPAVALLEAVGCTIHYMEPYPSAAEVAALTGAVQADAIISRQGPVNGAAMDASLRLRVIARHGVGVEDVDLPEAAARGILVTRAPGSNSRAVAEHTLAMILALAKQLQPFTASIAAGGWRGAGASVRDVAGMRLGLVGFGDIGRKVAVLAEAFGMAVAHHGSRSDGALIDMLARSDVLSLHCPYTPQTRHMINDAALAAMPAGSYVINTARGGLIDEAALLAALESGHIAGAALDVFEGEPPPADYPLRRHPRVITTPHVSGVTAGSLVTMGVMAAECVVAVLTGASVPAGRVVG
jgi:D-3-phosphoglycerate dehydrogenase